MFTRIAVLAVLLVPTATALTTPRSAQSQRNQAAASSTSVPVMPLSEVRIGMQGVIRTVFRGDQIEEFGFEVLGILKNLLGPKQDVILVQLKGDKPEFTGVVAGMSGSPAYIDGRQVGALSLRFGQFAKEPIAGVTPIESMLSVMKIDESRPVRASVPQRAETDADATEGMLASFEKAGQSKYDSTGPASLLTPIPSPLFFSGFSQEAIDRFAPFFRQHNLVPIQGGGGSTPDSRFSSENAEAFVPGAPVSAVLVLGDLGLYATGTVSYRDGNRVLAFGHPFFQVGPTDMPMARSRILKTLASSLASFKIAELGDIVGSIRQDRLTAIEGSIGIKPSMIPVSVNVDSPFRGKVPYRYEIFKHPMLTPVLVNLTLYESILNSLEGSEEMTIEYTGKIKIEGEPDLLMRDRLTSPEVGSFPVPVQAAFQIGDYFSRLYSNGYEIPKIGGVEVSFRVGEERSLITIEETRSEKSEVRPGDEVRIYVNLRPYRGEPVVESFRIKIPEQVTRGDILSVTVCDATTLKARERGFSQTRAGSLHQLIEALRRQRPGDHVYCQLSQYSPGYFVRDQMLPSLPLSVLSVMDTSRFSGEAVRINESPLQLEDKQVDRVVRGSRTLYLTVR
jgi:hypothetical protein